MATQFINRGEQIRHESELGIFEAQCAWSWTDDNRRTDPVYLSIRSVSYFDSKHRKAVPKSDKQLVAQRMKQELEQAERLVIELVELS